MISSTLSTMPSQYFWAMASFAVRVSTLPESQRLGTITLSSTIASAMSGLRRQFPDSSFPLNGPAWSLYYEYIGNILYALFVRKFNKVALSVLVFVAGCFTVYRCLTAPAGDIVGGWALNWEQQYVGMVRLMYPFFGGLLLSRLGWLIRLEKRAFWWCSLLIVVVLSIPRIGGEDGYWMNGLYEAFCIICIFPVIVSMGAGGKVTGKRSTAVCKFLGDISYPIYITHYPLVYTYTAWVCNNNATMAEGIPYMILTFVGAVVLAYACLKLYDEPVRKWLTDRFLKGKKK